MATCFSFKFILHIYVNQYGFLRIFRYITNGIACCWKRHRVFYNGIDRYEREINLADQGSHSFLERIGNLTKRLCSRCLPSAANFMNKKIIPYLSLVLEISVSTSALLHPRFSLESPTKSFVAWSLMGTS